MTTFLLEYDIGDLVYIKTELENNVWMIISIEIYPNNLFTYTMTCGTQVSRHYGIELTKDKDEKIRKYE